MTEVSELTKTWSKISLSTVALLQQQFHTWLTFRWEMCAFCWPVWGLKCHWWYLHPRVHSTQNDIKVWLLLFLSTKWSMHCRKFVHETLSTMIIAFIHNIKATWTLYLLHWKLFLQQLSDGWHWRHNDMTHGKGSTWIYTTPVQLHAPNMFWHFCINKPHTD